MKLISQILILNLFVFFLFESDNKINPVISKIKVNDLNVSSKRNYFSILVENKRDSNKNEESFNKNKTLVLWNKTPTKKRIIQYIKAITDTNSLYFIPESDRIATLDNDGTIWAEQPTYYQIEYVIFKLKKLESQHPEWKNNKLIQSALNHDLKKLREKHGIKGLAKLLEITQSGMSIEEFEKDVLNWVLNSYHPIHNKRYTELVYQPMQELIKLLKKNNFKVYIVSGGGTGFIRTFSKELFNIDKEFVIGSYQKLEYIENNNKIELIKNPDILCVSEDKGKVTSIQQIIGKKPVIAIGNSDRDIPMLKWSHSSKYKSLQILIHHTDKEREWKYDKGANNGRLNQGLSIATQQQWLVVDIKNDWNIIFN